MIKDELCEAICANDIALATQLINEGKTKGFDRSFNTPLHLALERCMDNEFINLLLDSGSFQMKNRNMHNKRPIDVAKSVYDEKADENSRLNVESVEHADHKERSNNK